MFSYKKGKQKSRAAVEGEMTIYTAAELKGGFVDVLDDPNDLEIDLGKVTEIDTAGIQLLILAKRERERRGHSLSLSNHSGSVQDVFDLMDLVGYFGDPVVLTKEHGEKHGS